MAEILFITGTDTDVGKTVLTSLLVRHLRNHGMHALAVKPFCSGGRDDARMLRKAQFDGPGLDEINPWHFRAALTPLLAARRAGQAVSREMVLEFIREASGRCGVLLVEGAGGLLSPLGEGYDARDLIAELGATPTVVSPNRLGAVNQVRLVMDALPARARRKARVVLMEPDRANQATRSNIRLLEEFFPGRITTLPRVEWPRVLEGEKLPKAVERVLGRWIGR